MRARAGLGRAGVLEEVRELGPEESIGGFGLPVGLPSLTCRRMKKHDAMHCRPGMVSHSEAEAPSSWKYCWATLRCSRESSCWPSARLVTPLRMYS